MKSNMNGCRLLWNALTVEAIEKRCQLLQARTKAFVDTLVAQKEIDRKSFAKAYALLHSDVDTEFNQLVFLNSVSPCKEIRDASNNAQKCLEEFTIEQSMREDVFKAFVRANESPEIGDKELNRFIEKKIKSGKRDGLHMEKSIRDKIEAIDKEMSSLGVDYNKSTNEENTVLDFTKEELKGLPNDVLENFEKNENGTFKVTLKYPDYFPCMEYCEVPETRKKLEYHFQRRCIDENIPRLDRLIKLRKDRAKLLGYKTHSDFVLEMRMAKNAESVDKFLNTLAKGLLPIRNREISRLLQLKEADYKEKNLPFDNIINNWDFKFYSRKALEIDYNVDKEEIKKYFPLIKVKSGIMKLYQTLLGLRFNKIETDNIWHPEVDTYEVIDVKDGDRLLGYFYMDLHPRLGKYGHAAAFSLQMGSLVFPTEELLQACEMTAEEIFKLVDNARPQVAVSALVANFTKPKADCSEESTLTHDEVETFFHEFGHIMHQVCGHTRYSMFSGSNVERDFVECPSQMLENWVWRKDGINSLLQDAKPLPEELADKLIKSRFANAGLHYARQVTLAQFDQIIHTSDEDSLDTEKILEDLYMKIMGIPKTQGTNMAASFGHLAGGYDAQYYGYLWSEVFAIDMFTSKFESAPDGGILSPTVGYEYRTKILHPGGSIDAEEMLREFLGRDPDQKPFFKSLGLE